MNRRRMMMQNRVVNLFDKNNADIAFKARLLSNGVILFGGDVQAKKSFVSYFVSVEYGKSYTLIRKPIDTSNSAYNRWVFYNKSKNVVIPNEAKPSRGICAFRLPLQFTGCADPSTRFACSG